MVVIIGQEPEQVRAHRNPELKDPKPKSREVKKWKSQNIFFPLAALHAAVLTPLSVYAMQSSESWPRGLIGGGHAFEMFFGFVLALVAGYTLGPVTSRRMLALIFVWFTGRILLFAPVDPMASRAATVLFAVLLGMVVLPRFRHAKKWRNKSVTWILLGIFLLPFVWLRLFAYPELNTSLREPAQIAALLLFGLLMAFMGGRIISPAVAGHFQASGRTPSVRLQPRIEASILVLMGGAILTIAVSQLRYLSAMLAFSGGVLVLVRLVRWKLWKCRSRLDLLGFGLGYLCLGCGLMMLSGYMVSGEYFLVGVHVITIGAVGCLSTMVMLQQYHLRRFRAPPPSWLVLGVLSGLVLALVLRVLASVSTINSINLLGWSVSMWSAAYILVFLQLVSFGFLSSRNSLK